MTNSIGHNSNASQIKQRGMTTDVN